MRKLKFTVNEQKISHDTECSFSGIVQGTVGYLKAAFKFSAEWSGTVKVAEFRRYTISDPISVPIINNECMVPEEVTGGKVWHVKIVGKKGDMILTTGNCKVDQEE